MTLPTLLLLATNLVVVHFRATAPGSYQLLSTKDFFQWTVEASGVVEAGEHVCARLVRKEREFFTVRFVNH